MKANRKLFVLSGLPFSGKSTLLKSVSELTSIKTISFDVLWKELEQDPNEKNKLSFEYLTEIIDKRIAQLLGEGYSVMYDSLNDTPDQRERLSNIAKVANAPSMTIYLETPLEIIKSRRLENTKSMGRHLVDDENFDKSINKFVVPLEDENVLTFRYDEDLTLWIKKNLSEYLR